MSYDVKFLTIGDIHFKLKNKDRTDKLYIEVEKLIKNEKFDFLVCLGDILNDHEKIHVECLNRANKFLIDLSRKIKVFVLIGNHDRTNNRDFMSETHPFTVLKFIDNLEIIDKTKFITINNINFIFVPYVPIGKFKEALQILGDDILNKNKIIFAHQEFKGGFLNSFRKSENGDEWSINNSYIISGHLHDYHIPQKNIIYTGSPFQHTFAESIDKKLVSFEVDNKYNLRLSHHKLNIPKKITYNVKYNLLYDTEYLKLLSFNTIDEYKVNIVCSQEEVENAIIYKKNNNLQNIKINIILNKDDNNIENLNSVIKKEDFITIYKDLISINKNAERYLQNIIDNI